MKCLICDASVDEGRPIPPVEGPGGKLIDDVTGRIKLARELESWTHVTLTAQLPGDCKTLVAGHVCKKHDLKVLDLAAPYANDPKSEKKS